MEFTPGQTCSAKQCSPLLIQVLAVEGLHHLRSCGCFDVSLKGREKGKFEGFPSSRPVKILADLHLLKPRLQSLKPSTLNLCVRMFPLASPLASPEFSLWFSLGVPLDPPWFPLGFPCPLGFPSVFRWFPRAYLRPPGSVELRGAEMFSNSMARLPRGAMATAFFSASSSILVRFSGKPLRIFW